MDEDRTTKADPIDDRLADSEAARLKKIGEEYRQRQKLAEENRKREEEYRKIAPSVVHPAPTIDATTQSYLLAIWQQLQQLQANASSVGNMLSTCNFLLFWVVVLLGVILWRIW